MMTVQSEWQQIIAQNSLFLCMMLRSQRFSKFDRSTMVGIAMPEKNATIPAQCVNNVF